jgi:hypothetical protein
LAIFSILRGLIPGLGIAYFPLQVFGVEMRLIESFACRVGQYLWVTHDRSEPTIAAVKDGILKPL